MSAVDPASEDDVRVGVVKGHAKSIDEAVKRTALSNQEQLSLCVMLSAAAMMRIIVAGKASGMPLNRGQRHKMIRSAIEDFERACRLTLLGDEPEEPSHEEERQ